MKKKMCVLILSLCLASSTACGNNVTPDKSSDAPVSFQRQEIPENNNIIADKEKAAIGFEELNEIVTTDIENTIASIKTEYEKLVTEMDTYDKFLKNVDKMEAFYKMVCEENRLLCIRMREYSIAYAKEIMASDKSNDEKYNDLDELYDCIYDDAGDDIYDEIYDDILDDMYDDFYDGILDDAYDNGVPYAEWSDARSDEYHRWSDTRSDVYGEWSDFRSDVYGFWSNMRSALWKDDIEKAEKEIADFQEEIEKIKSKSIGSDTQITNKEGSSDAALEDIENNDTNVNEELVDGMRPEFKEAMDSYEAFYDEYCDIIKKYMANPSDLGLLASYTDMLSQAAEMSKKFEVWEDNEMNDEELKYFLDVNNRVTKKLLEVYE